jgi:hypothetical protein
LADGKVLKKDTFAAVGLDPKWAVSLVIQVDYKSADLTVNMVDLTANRRGVHSVCEKVSLLAEERVIGMAVS